MLGHPHNLFTGRVAGYLAVAFGFACMFVFPAIPIGNSVGIDPALAMTAALLFLYPTIFFGPSFPFILLMMVPQVQSALAWFASGGAFAPAMMPKNVVAFFLSRSEE